MSVAYINTLSGVSVVIKGRPFTVSSDDKGYEDIIALLDSGGSEAEIEDVITRVAKKLQNMVSVTPDLEYSGGVILYKGETLHNYAADRLIGLLEAGHNHLPLARFLENLQANPSKNVVDRLYAFLEKGSMPLTDDGCFLAYKSVRSDFKDIHSGKFDNSVGQEPSMRRNQVDEDQNRTCSTGLHVCSYSYLPSFSSVNGHVMICKINPADVVAIPTDYNDAKMRVSRYVVIGEVEGYYANKRDQLGDMGRANKTAVPGFSVVWETMDNADDLNESYYTLEQAKTAAHRQFSDLLRDDEEEVRVEVINDAGVVVYRITDDGIWQAT